MEVVDFVEDEERQTERTYCSSCCKHCYLTSLGCYCCHCHQTEVVNMDVAWMNLRLTQP